MAKKKRQSDVLKYTREKKDLGLVRRHYNDWRKEKGIPYRCDNPNCRFHTEPLVWNDRELLMILDHIDGVNSNDDPDQLRYLCPNCNQQLDTHGGGNKGKVEKEDSGFTRKEGDRRHATAVVEGVEVRASAQPVSVVVSTAKNTEES